MSYKSSISSQNIEDILKKIDGAIVLDSAILSLSSSSTSTTISNAVGGSSGFTEILNSLRGGGITFGIIKDDINGRGFIQATMYAHPVEDKLTISWLDSLNSKNIEISKDGESFSISNDKTQIKGKVEAYWEDERTLVCDVTALVPQYIRDTFWEESAEESDTITDPSVIKQYADYSKYSVILKQYYASNFPTVGEEIWSCSLVPRCSFSITVIVPQRIKLLSESEYESTSEWKDTNKTIYMIYPDA